METQEVHTCGGIPESDLNELQLDEQVRFEIFFEICYKFGFIHCPNVNETFELDYPDYQNTFII